MNENYKKSAVEIILNSVPPFALVTCREYNTELLWFPIATRIFNIYKYSQTYYRSMDNILVINQLSAQNIVL